MIYCSRLLKTSWYNPSFFRISIFTFCSFSRFTSSFHFIVYNCMWLNWIEKRSNWPRINHVMVSSMSDWPQITHLKRWNVEERQIYRCEWNGINKHSCKRNRYYCYVKSKKRSSLLDSLFFDFKICLIPNVCGFLGFTIPYSVEHFTKLLVLIRVGSSR